MEQWKHPSLFVLVINLGLQISTWILVLSTWEDQGMPVMKSINLAVHCSRFSQTGCELLGKVDSKEENIIQEPPKMWISAIQYSVSRAKVQMNSWQRAMHCEIAAVQDLHHVCFFWNKRVSPIGELLGEQGEMVRLVSGLAGTQASVLSR